MADTPTQPSLWIDPEPGTLGTAVVWTLAYADVFDYPLTSQEVHRYLVGREASASRLRERLLSGTIRDAIARVGDYFMLPGREYLVETRRRRAHAAADLWPKAIRFGSAIARLPFVRMVAVSGALSMDNVERDHDIDYLIVTQIGRLWLSRAIIIQFVVKPASRLGTELCPNYILTEKAFTQFPRDLFTAHELVQMVAVAGTETCEHLYRLNRWIADFLPNAYGRRRAVGGATPGCGPSRIAAGMEAVMRSRIGAGLEHWEMARKVRRFERQRQETSESSFTPDQCKGHFGAHGARVQRALQERLAVVADKGSRSGTRSSEARPNGKEVAFRQDENWTQR